MAKRKRKVAAAQDGEGMAQNDDDDGGGASKEGDADQNLYEILGVQKTASQAEIKKAYHRLALQLHPDKNPDDKDANEKFQTLQSVIAVLGDPEKRAVYDETGSVEEADILGEPGKSLYEYFRTLYKPVTEGDIEEFAASYRGSKEETEDLKKLYIKCEGNMERLFHMLMCSEPQLDSHRFMEAIDDAIECGELKENKAYRKWAKAVAKQTAPANPLASRPKKKNGKKDSSTDLVTAIRSRGKQKMDSLFSAMEKKYSKNKQKKEEEIEEPTEEEFQAARQRIKRSRGK